MKVAHRMNIDKQEGKFKNTHFAFVPFVTLFLLPFCQFIFEPYHMNSLSIATICCVFLFQAYKPASENVLADCKVLMESISDSYEGDCKKGVANGMGKATGTDSYDGEFKKGLPHGTGIYTWANGSVFTGHWKNGLKDGAGKLINADSAKLEGYWVKDEYMGLDKEPFQVISKGPAIQKIRFRRVGDEPSRVDLQFNQNFKAFGALITRATGSYGTIPPGSSHFQLKFPVVEFPFQGQMSFDYISNTTKRSFANNEFEIKISQAGHWEVTVEVIATQ